MPTSFTLKVLGGAWIEGPDGPLTGRATQRHRLALLALLAATPDGMTRDKLVGMLWPRKKPERARHALSDSIYRINRALADEPLVAAGDRLRLEIDALPSDLAKFHHALEEEEWQRAVDVYGGPFLDGFHLSELEFEGWVVRERQHLAGRHTNALEMLAEERAARDDQRGAVAAWRRRAALDPCDSRVAVRLMKALETAGNRAAAVRHARTHARHLERELGIDPEHDVLALAARIRKADSTVVSVDAPGSPAALPGGRRENDTDERTGPPLFGQEEVVAKVDEAVSAATEDRWKGVLLLLGDPGIGKTRMLSEAESRVRAEGGVVLAGRAYEAEMVRPYGAWIDALRSVSREAIPQDVRGELARLLPELGITSAGPGGRSRLFSSVVRAFLELAPGASCVALVLDDIQWLDEASAALVHYVARSTVESRLLVAAAARPGELADNPAALRLIRALGREGLERSIEMKPLSREETAALAASVAPDVDAGRVYAESRGNPLFVLEFLRAESSGSGFPATLAELIDDRLERLDPSTRELVSLAAALGRTFDLETLARVAGQAAPDLLGSLERLERYGMLRGATREGENLLYDFAHDLIRRQAYARLSGPRRTLVHRQITHALAELPDPDGTFAGDVAHHAALAGDLQRAAEACVKAGERCLRVFAYPEAADLAERGIEYAEALPTKNRIRCTISLLDIVIRSGARADKALRIEDHLMRVILEAEAHGLGDEVAQGFFTLSVLHYEVGKYGKAHASALSSAEAARTADPESAAHAFANVGRCLALLEQELGRARRLLDEARELADQVGLRIPEIPLGRALLAHHAGELEEALALLAEALSRSRSVNDHWRESIALARFAMIELERRRPAAAFEWARELRLVAEKIGQERGKGSEIPFAAALEALARFDAREEGADELLRKALSDLRTIDARLLVAYVQNLAARSALEAGQIEETLERAVEALDEAQSVERSGEVAVAHAITARAKLAAGQRDEAEHHASSAVSVAAGDPGRWTARAWGEAVRAARAVDLEIPTIVTPKPPPRGHDGADTGGQTSSDTTQGTPWPK